MLGGGRKDREAELERLLERAQQRVAELEAELRGRAERDPVTGLATLERFRIALELETARARRHARALSVAVLDVDDFRSLMARHGHVAGDEVLVQVSRVLDTETRATDVACRAGGDEFAVLMPETDLPGAAAFCERILRALEGTKAGPVEGIRVSAGIAAYDRARGAGEALGEAYKALDHSRRLGGGRVTAGPEHDGVESAIDNEQRDAVSALAVTLLERDRYTGEHSESVLAMVDEVARGLGLDDDEVDRVKAAALLHDIGKVAIPDAILNKAGPLDDDEWKLMKDHTVVGERILRAIPGLGGVARIVRHEHERWDGTGYPDGLAGEDIPVGARIILACDAYHAMTSDRPYREAMSHAEAMRELTKGAGTQFDPAVVEVLVGQLYSRRQQSASPPQAAAGAGWTANKSNTSADPSKVACTALKLLFSSRSSISRSSRVASASSTGTREVGCWTTSALWTSMPASSSAARTAWRSPGAVTTSYTSSSMDTSSAPASIATTRSSSDQRLASTTTTPRFSNR